MFKGVEDVCKSEVNHLQKMFKRSSINEKATRLESIGKENPTVKKI